MRIWSIHPKYLDARGLVALWREALLAQAVLKGRTRGYTRHPQLIRFREQKSPVAAIADYLRAVHKEAEQRGYRFDVRKIESPRACGKINVTTGQLRFEWGHLLDKVGIRDPEWNDRLIRIKNPEPHPLFRAVRGEIANWERQA